MNSAAIFDVDGTLLDSVDYHARAWQETFARYGIRTTFEEVGSQIGKGGDQLMPVFVPKEMLERVGKKMKDEVQKWHVHDCTFQFVYVMNGWATFEYEGQGQKTIRKGDTILQTPGIKHREIACSEDFEVLEIVSPANFATRVVEGPQEKAQAAE